MSRALPLALALLAACGAPRTGPPADFDVAGELLPPDALGFEVVWRQSITATWPDGERTFDGAVQVRGGELLVLALSPVGRPGFVVRWDGASVALENHTDMDLPFPPEVVLLDVQRAFYPYLSGDALEGTVHGERVREVREGGRRVERTFERLDGAPPGVVRITYEWGDGEWGDGERAAPRRAVLENGWYGYRLEVVTHDETLLPAEGGA